MDDAIKWHINGRTRRGEKINAKMLAARLAIIFELIGLITYPVFAITPDTDRRIGIGHLLLAFARPLWLRVTVALAFVVPAGIAGFHATHGIVQHLMPSEAWQLAFSLLGAVAVAITACCRITAVAAPGPAGQGTAAV